MSREALCPHTSLQILKGVSVGMCVYRSVCLAGVGGGLSMFVFHLCFVSSSTDHVPSLQSRAGVSVTRGAELPRVCKGVGQGVNDDVPWSSRACGSSVGVWPCVPRWRMVSAGPCCSQGPGVPVAGRVRWEGQQPPKRREWRLPEGQGLCVYMRLGQVGGTGLPYWRPEKGLRWGKDPITRILTGPVKIWVSVLR